MKTFSPQPRLGADNHLDEFLDSCELIVIMVKHDQIKQNVHKLKGKIVLDCHNVIDIPGVYHI